MPFEFKPHIRTAHCERDLVVLNLKADSYQIILDIDVADLNAALGNAARSHSRVLDPLWAIDAIQESASTYDQIVSTRFGGFFEQRWMTLGRIAQTLFKLMPADSDRATAASGVQDHTHKLNVLMRSLNAAFLWDLSGNKCLTYSYALVRLARGQGIPVKLVIGVRTRPFFSHAWVELHRNVVNDDPMLRQILSVILEA